MYKEGRYINRSDPMFHYKDYKLLIPPQFGVNGNCFWLWSLDWDTVSAKCCLKSNPKIPTYVSRVSAARSREGYKLYIPIKLPNILLPYLDSEESKLTFRTLAISAFCFSPFLSPSSFIWCPLVAGRAHKKFSSVFMLLLGFKQSTLALESSYPSHCDTGSMGLR